VIFMSTIDYKAAQKWAAIPREVRSGLVSNVFCRTCGETTITDYSIENDKLGLVSKGKCQICSGPVARLVETD